MDLERAIEWLSRYGATVRFENVPGIGERLTVSARDHHIMRTWTQIDADNYRGSVPCRELLYAVEYLDHYIGS